MASFTEGLLIWYNWSAVNFNPFLTMSAYTCLPNNNGSHIPSSADAFKIIVTGKINNRNIFFMI